MPVIALTQEMGSLAKDIAVQLGQVLNIDGCNPRHTCEHHMPQWARCAPGHRCQRGRTNGDGTNCADSVRGGNGGQSAACHGHG
jgi:hypothetical protein